MSGESETPFEGVLRQINDTVPFEPGYYNESYLDRRITARMRRRDTESHTEYERLLREDDGEREGADGRAHDQRDGVLPQPGDVGRAPRRAPRADERTAPGPRLVGSLGGRSGAVLGRDVGLRRPRDRRVTREVLGSDISEEALDSAREGVYHTPARPTSPRSWSRSRTLTATSSATRTRFGCARKSSGSSTSRRTT